MRAFFIISAASIVVTISTLRAEEANSRPPEQPAPATVETRRETPVPRLSKGMWWVTETHRVGEALDGSGSNTRPVYKERISTHKWEVTGQEKVSDKVCWVIDVTDTGVLETVEKTVSEYRPPQFTLHIDMDNGALVTLSGIIDLRPWDTRATVEKHKITCSGKSASVNQRLPDTRVPLDVPLLPTTWMYPLERKTTFKEDEGEVRQTLSPFNLSDNPDHKAMLVVLQHDTHGIRTMLWDNECPWWKEWSCVRKDGSIGWLWYARTIDWKGKQEVKETGGTATKASDRP